MTHINYRHSFCLSFNIIFIRAYDFRYVKHRDEQYAVYLVIILKYCVKYKVKFYSWKKEYYLNESLL